MVSAIRPLPESRSPAAFRCLRNTSQRQLRSFPCLPFDTSTWISQLARYKPQARHVASGANLQRVRPPLRPLFESLPRGCRLPLRESLHLRIRNEWKGNLLRVTPCIICYYRVSERPTSMTGPKHSDCLPRNRCACLCVRPNYSVVSLYSPFGDILDVHTIREKTGALAGRLFNATTSCPP